MLLQQTWDRFSSVLAPKVFGAWNLNTLTQDCNLDFFVCFSSIASLVGSPGQSNYAAANAFLDKLSFYRQALGLNGLTINWGPWLNTGMVASLDDQKLERLKAQGITPITPEQALQTLELLLSQKSPQVGVMQIDWTKFVQQSSSTRNIKLLEDFTSPIIQRKKRSDFLEKLKATPNNAQKQLLITYVRSQIVKFLGWTSPDKIEPRQRLFDLGMDSLMAIELKNSLESTLECSLRTTLLFDYPTLEALVNYIFSKVIAEESSEAKTSETSENANTTEITYIDDELDSLLLELEQISDVDIQKKLGNESRISN